MKNRLENQMENSEYSITVKMMNEEATLCKNFVELLAPAISKAGADSFEILNIITYKLIFDGYILRRDGESFGEGIAKVWRIFSKDGIKIVTVSTKGNNLSSTKIDFSIEGREDLVTNFCQSLPFLIEKAIEDELSDAYDYGFEY
jgi:hypothetical protein